jgi:microcystin-dependent protein
MTQTILQDSLMKNQRAMEEEAHALQRGAANDSVPVGTILMFGGSKAPPGYLLCDGLPVSRTIYAVLFGVLGTRYGIGDGSTTFNLPNLKNRFPVGLSPGTAPASALAQTGGEEFHTLTATEIPAHGHPTGNANSYFQATAGEYAYLTTGSSDSAAYQGAITSAGGSGTGAYVYITPSDNPAGTGTAGLLSLTGNTGGGGTHNNMPPYITLNFIIAVGSG